MTFVNNADISMSVRQTKISLFIFISIACDQIDDVLICNIGAL